MAQFSSLRLYNTLSKREEVFESVRTDEHGKQLVTMYTCGPTVYGRPHVGNYAAFLMADLLRRWLEVKGCKVVHVKNITDVGHLVRDRDEGEDKIEKQAREEHGAVTHESVMRVARTYEEQYLEDERALNMLEPAHRPHASAFVDAMKTMIETLLKRGVAYVTSDGIYFDVATFPHYGALSGNTLENLSAGARVEVNEEKRHPADFALWKFCVGANEHHALRWSSPEIAAESLASDLETLAARGRWPEAGSLPDGFPGWHIECSAMAASLLGDTIDIHTGGEDNIFPHHECEIAQSECVTGAAPFVRYWLHRRRIDLEGEKMSKSLGNVLTIPDIVAKGYDPLDIRYYLLSVHYRTNLKFSWKGMDDARKARLKIAEWMHEMETADASGDCSADQHQALAERYAAFRAAMDSDLNTSGALAAVFDLMTWSRTAGPLCVDTTADLLIAIAIIRHTFGCFEPAHEEALPADVQALAEERAAARAEKNFAESDRLRDAIAGLGYQVKDTPDGQKVTKM